MINLTSCPICAQVGFSDFLACKDFTTSGESFHLKRCDCCGLVFTDPRPGENEIGKYYLSDSYISHSGGEKKLTDRIYLAARKLAVRTKRKLISKISNGKSILDFGCGTGEFLNEMRKNNWHISGIEPSNIARAKAEKLNQTKIFSDLNSSDTQTYDVITLWHVLEHVHNLNETLDLLKKKLNDSGKIIVAVPNRESYDAVHYQSHWAGYDVPRHLWHFSKKNMKELLSNHGFKQVDVFPMYLDSFYVSLLSESYRAPKKNKFSILFSAFFVGLISNLKAMKSTNYSSLIYIAKR